MNFDGSNFSVPCRLKISNDEYHSFPAVGSTGLKRILRSPKHYLFEKENPSEQTPAMRFGSACHQAILEPELFKNAVEMPLFEGKGSRAAREQFYLENHGKLILKPEEMDAVRGMLKAISEHKTARGLLAGGAAEEAFFWQDADTGLVCKAKPDFLRKGRIIVDVKTTTNADPSEFPRQIANLKYHLSAALYLDGVSAVTGEKHDQFIIVAVEKEPPYGVSVLLLDEGTIGAGRFLYKKALRTLKECKDKNQWPSYPDQILSTAIPAYAFPSEEF